MKAFIPTIRLPRACSLRAISAWCALLLALTAQVGCLGGISKVGARAVYAMPEPDVAATTRAAAPWHQSLLVETPSSLPPLSSADMLVLEDNGELQVLPQSRWSAPAPLLLQDLLVRQLAASGQLHNVAGGPQSWSQALRLVSELRSFELRPVQGGLRAQIELTVRLVCARDARLISSHAGLRAQSGVLNTAQAPGGLREVAVAVSLELSRWLQSLPEPECD